MTLSRDWDFRDLTGWLWSEKFDGVRAYWDGAQLWTRGGNVIQAPKSFLKFFPAGVELDGELWAGHGTLEVASNAAVHGIWDSRLVFRCFDCPDVVGNWTMRILCAASFSNKIIQPVDHGVVEFRRQVSIIAQEIINRGGEGTMFRNPNVKSYEQKRTINLCRVKTKNLFEPWRSQEEQWAQEAWQRKDAAMRERKNGRECSQDGNRIPIKQKQVRGNGFRMVSNSNTVSSIGFDVRLAPFDPAIEWNVRRMMSNDGDYSECVHIL